MQQSEDLFVEVLGHSRHSVVRDVVVEASGIESHSHAFAFEHKEACGSGFIAQSADGVEDRVLLWQFNSQAAEEVTMLEVAAGRELGHSHLRMRYPSPVYPKALLIPSPGGAILVALSAQGVLHCLQLPQVSSLRPGESILAGHPQIRHLPLEEWVGILGQPSCLEVVGRHIVIGGTSGALVCVPQARLLGGTGEETFELHESKTYLGSFFNRSQEVVPVKDMAVLPLSGQTLLLSIHGNGALRVWDLKSRKRVFSHALLIDSMVEACCPQRLCVAPTPASAGSACVAVQFGPHQGFPSTNMPEQVALYRLSHSTAGGFKLEVVSSGLCSLHGSLEEMLASDDDNWGFWAWTLATGRTPQLTAVAEEGGEGPLAVLSGDSDSAPAIDPGIQTRLWSIVAPEGVGCEEVARHVLARLLVPGEVSASAISQTLAEMDKSVEAEHLRATSTHQIIDFLVQTADLTGEEPAVLYLLDNISRMYKGFWSLQHQPYGLLRSPSTGGVSVVRAGPCLTHLRPGSRGEVLLSEPQGLSQGVVAMDDSVPEALHQVEQVVQAAGLLGKLLRSSVNSAALIALWGAGDYSSTVVPRLLQAIRLAGTIGPRDLAAGALQQWNQQGRLADMHISRLLSPIPDLVEVVREALLEICQPPVLLFRGASLSSQALRANIATYRAAAQASLQILQGLLLLIGYLGETATIATWQLPHEQVETLAMEVAPQVEAALRQMAALEWLCVTQDDALVSDPDPSSMLDHLKLGGGVNPSRPQPRPTQERLLAELFLEQQPPLDAGYGGSEVLQPATLFSLSSSPQDEESYLDALLEQVLGVALVLLAGNRVSNLEAVLKLATCLGQDPAIMFLQGYSILAGLKHLPAGTDRAEALQSAMQLLFQAASALAVTAAHQPAPLRSPSRSWLQRLLQYLQRQMTGACTMDPPEGLQLQCYEVLMTMCEQMRCLDGATRFAQAASHQVARLRAAAEAPGSEERLAQLVAREGCIWANLFVYALDAGSYQEAYAALEENPVVERRLDCLQTLVHTLCERRELRVLTGLPYASSLRLRRDGRDVNSSLLEEAIRILERRAANAELKAAPQPYIVLANFQAAKGDWRSAAAAHLAFARRMQEEDYPCSAVSTRLGAAVSTLGLVEPHFQWLEDPRRLPEPTLAPFTGRLGTGANSATSDIRGSGEGTAVVSLPQLQKEAQAAHALAAWLPNTLYSRPLQAVKSLHNAGRYEAAVDLAEAVLQGEGQAVAVRAALAGLATACMQKPGGQARATRNPFSGVEDSWGLLQRLVERHSRSQHASQLWAAVAEAILVAERRAALPEWLLLLFKAGERGRGMAGGPGDPVALLRLYMQHGKLMEAGHLAQGYLRCWLTEISDVERQRHMGAWFPHALLSILEQRLQQSREPLCKELGAALHQDHVALQMLAADQSSIMDAHPSKHSGMGNGVPGSVPLVLNF